MCHVSFNLVGIHRPEADRLPSPPGLKEGGWEEGMGGDHVITPLIWEQRVSRHPPACPADSVCARVCVRVDALHTHLRNIQDSSSPDLRGPFGGNTKK